MNESTFNTARRLFEQGLQLLQQGQAQQAEERLMACLQVLPGRVSTLVALGATRLQLNRAEPALDLLTQALEQDPSRTDAWGHRADALLRLGRAAEALQALEHTDPAEPASRWHRAQALLSLGQHDQALPLLDTLLAQDEHNATLWLDHGRTLQHLGRHAEAGPSYNKAVTLDSNNGPGWNVYGQWLRDEGDLEAAQAALEKALALGHDPELNRWLLAALNASNGAAMPAHPPEHYVRMLFDGYANEFDHHLTRLLLYQGPEHLAALLQSHPPRCTGTALDLGCGTGLCAALLLTHAQAVDGVDLSGAMLDRARGTGLYRHLHQDDVVRHLQSTEQQHAVLLAADVLIYIGDVQALFAAAQRVLLPGGVLAFTAEEAADAERFELRCSQRYAHGSVYLQAQAQQAGLQALALRRAPLRLHEGQMLMGLYVVLGKRDG